MKVLSKTRVFLVEDQDILRESLEVMLSLDDEIELVGHSSTAEQAIIDLEPMDADVVLMNIRLPGMDGIEATRRLKKIRGDLKIIILTSYYDEYLEEAIESGASGYMLKSCTRHQLVDAIKQASQGATVIDDSLTKGLMQELIDLRKTASKQVLTQRQMQVLNYLANGLRYQPIADKLFISKSTLHREIREILRRLEVNDVVQAVYVAHKKRII